MEGINNIRTSIAALGRFRAYREALNLVSMVRALQVTGSLRDQLVRASESVALNLAEGACDATRAMKTRSIGIARASLWETGAAIDLVALTGENVQPIAEAIAALDCALRPLARRR
jgi:four helix bundle protein